jgi:hypothetical protein
MVLNKSLAWSLLAVINDFANSRGLGLTSQATKLGSSLGMAWSLPNTTRARSQRKDVTGAAEAIGAGFGVGEGSACESTVASTDSGGDRGVGRVDRDSVCGASRVLVVGDHLRKIERFGEFGGERSADVTRRVADEEAHLLGCHIFSSDDQIGFVLARGVIENDEELSISESLNRVGD